VIRRIRISKNTVFLCLCARSPRCTCTAKRSTSHTHAHTHRHRQKDIFPFSHANSKKMQNAINIIIHHIYTQCPPPRFRPLSTGVTRDDQRQRTTPHRAASSPTPPPPPQLGYAADKESLKSFTLFWLGKPR